MPAYIVESKTPPRKVSDLKAEGLTIPECKARLREDVDQLAAVVEGFRERTGATIDVLNKDYLNKTVYIKTDPETAAALRQEPGIGAVDDPRLLEPERKPPGFSPG